MTEKEFDMWEVALELFHAAAGGDLEDALVALEEEQGGQHLVVGVQGPGVRLLMERAPEDTPTSGRLFRGGKAARGFLGG